MSKLLITCSFSLTVLVGCGGDGDNAGNRRDPLDAFRGQQVADGNGEKSQRQQEKSKRRREKRQRRPRQPATPRFSALEEFFGTVPVSRQAALDAFAAFRKRTGQHLFFAKDGVSVKEARLSNGGVNENMIRALQWFPELEVVSLSFYLLRDEWLVHLKPLRNLKQIGFTNAPVGDAAIKHIETLTNLESLHAGNTKVTDACVKSLVKLRNLKGLVLMRTQITDEGLAELEQLPNLKVLSLRGSKVTQAGIDKFRKAHPDCNVLKIK